MVSSVSQISLCNRALLAISAKAQISSLNPPDNSAAANSCALLFVPTFEQLGRSAWWNCLSKQGTLSLIGAAAGTPEGGQNGYGIAPPTPWLYLYAYPSDCLKARTIVPTFPFQGVGGPPLTTINNGAAITLRGSGQIPFKIGYSTDASGNPLNVLITNQSQAQLIYTVDQTNPVIWDTQFQAAFVASLGAFLVPALSGHIPLMQLQIGIAERIIGEARASDGNEGSNSQDHTPDWIVARAGGSGGWYGGVNSVAYENMCWPAVAG